MSFSNYTIIDLSNQFNIERQLLLTENELTNVMLSWLTKKSDMSTLKNAHRMIALIFFAAILYSATNFVTKANEMNQTKKKAVAQSNWGGEGINLTVEKEGVKIVYDCAEAEITEKLMIDKKGRFSAEGTYLRHNPGAIRLKFKPKKQKAKFEGIISDNKMTLSVTLAETENNEEFGEYSLEKDRIAKLRRCL